MFTIRLSFLPDGNSYAHARMNYEKGLLLSYIVNIIVIIKKYWLYLSVGAVTVFIDVCSFYMVNRYTFPLVVDNCCRGWVNNIIVTSSAQRKVVLRTVVMMHAHTP